MSAVRAYTRDRLPFSVNPSHTLSRGKRQDEVASRDKGGAVERYSTTTRGTMERISEHNSARRPGETK